MARDGESDDTLMKMTIQVVIEDEDQQTPPIVNEVISLERCVEDLRSSTLGLQLDEAKEILAEIQTVLVTTQATRFQERQCSCPECGTPYQKNGTHQLTFRTLYGTIKLASQRFYTVRANKQRRRQTRTSRSVLAHWRNCSRSERLRSLSISRPSGLPS